MNNDKQDSLDLKSETPSSLATVNGRCIVRDEEGMRSVQVSGTVVYHFAVGDKVMDALWMVQAVECGWAKPTELVAAMQVSRVKVFRSRRQYLNGGAEALAGMKRGPKGPRLGKKREAAIRKWNGEDVSGREIARRLSVSEGTVRTAMGRLGLKPARARGEQETLALPEMDNAQETVVPSPESPSPEVEKAAVRAAPTATPTVIEQPSAVVEPIPMTLDTDPTDRSMDRALAALGQIRDAAPLFAPGLAVPKAGVLLAMPVLVASGVFAAAKASLSDLGPAFYGLRTMLVVLLSLALLRVKRPENLKEYSPEELGRVLGLDRAPEVKTLRRKLMMMSTNGEWVDEFLGDLVKRRVAAREEALGFLYADGHVRVYHGKADLPKAHSARMRLSVPATQELWVNDADGQPLFFVTQEAHGQLVSELPAVLKQVRGLVGKDRRVTVVFDRGGWSPKLFEKMDADDFDVLTYRKGTADAVPEDAFTDYEVPGTDGKARMLLHDTLVAVGTGDFRMRQVTRLKDGHQTHVVTTRKDLPALEVAMRMFDRWRQENFFKYMRQEYAIDALVEYGTEEDDPNRLVPNPARKVVEKDLRKARAEVVRLEASLGAAAMDNPESRRTMRSFKIATGTGIGIPLGQAREQVARLIEQRAALPERVPVGSVKAEVVRLKSCRKRLSDGLKMLAYQAESDLVTQVAPFYARSLDEGRRLVLAALQSAADIEVADGELRVTLAPQSSPHRSRAIAELCRVLDDTATCFPGTNLRLRYAVRPAKGE